MAIYLPFLIGLFNILLNHTVLTKKRSVVYCVISFIINTAILMFVAYVAKQSINNLTLNKYVFNFIAALYFGYIYLVFEESFSKKLFVMFSTWVASNIIMVISIALTNLYFDNAYTIYYQYGIRYILQGALLLLLFQPRFREHNRKTLFIVQDSTMNLMSVYMIIAFLLLINNTTAGAITLRNFTTIYDFMLFVVFIILGFVVVFSSILTSYRVAMLQLGLELAEKKSEENFKIANYDLLTGVATRLSIFNKLSDAISEYGRCSRKFAVLMLDVDKFKSINDNYGHRTGDEALKHITQKIKQSLRESDMVGRVGGDEFVILQRDIDSDEDVLALINRLFDSLKSNLFFEQYEIHISLSVGISLFHDYSQGLDVLLDQADCAMYDAKKSDGNSYCFFNDIRPK